MACGTPTLQRRQLRLGETLYSENTKARARATSGITSPLETQFPQVVHRAPDTTGNEEQVGSKPEGGSAGRTFSGARGPARPPHAPHHRPHWGHHSRWTPRARTVGSPAASVSEAAGASGKCSFPCQPQRPLGVGVSLPKVCGVITWAWAAAKLLGNVFGTDLWGSG